MRLDIDCVRDLLLCIEENTGLRKVCSFIDCGLTESACYVGNESQPFDYQLPLDNKYKNDKLIYHLNYCVEDQLITRSDISTMYCIVISDLTPLGHQLLNNIRDDSIWGKVKNILSGFSSVSLPVVGNTAGQVLSIIIKHKLNLD